MARRSAFVGADLVREFSQPRRPPEGILPHCSSQSRTQRIGNDIPGNRDYIFLSAQRPIMKRLSPDLIFPAAQATHLSCTDRLHPSNRFGQVLTPSKLKQPMDMIRHKHPGEQPVPPDHRAPSKSRRSNAARLEVCEQGCAPCRSCGDQIDVTRNRRTPFAQCAVARNIGKSRVGHNRTSCSGMSGFRGQGPLLRKQAAL